MLVQRMVMCGWRRSGRRLPLLLATATALVGAGEPDCLRAQAGVRQFRAREVLRIDGNSNLFTTIPWVTSSTDGQLVVVGLPRERQVAVFDAAGRRLATVGRDGGGPGEFRSIAGFGWYRGSLWIADMSLRRTTLIGSDWKSKREYGWPLLDEDRGEGRTSITGRVLGVVMVPSDSEVVVMAQGVVSDLPKIGRATGDQPVLVRTAMNGGNRRIIGRMPGALCWGATSFEVTGFLCPVYKVSFAHDGSGYVVAGPSLGWPGDGTVSLVSVRANGDTIANARVRIAPVRISQRARDSILAIPRPPSLVASRPAPGEYYPPVRSVLMGRDGAIWIESWTESTVRIWHVFERRGGLRGTVRIPADVSLKDVGPDFALGVLTDDTDVPSVVRYAIQ